MKKLLITLLFVSGILTTGLLAQTETTIIGGLNFGSVKFNNNNYNDEIDISMKSGFTFGVESLEKVFIIGGAFDQRGANFKDKDSDVKISHTYNYLSGYILIPISIQKELTVFGGCQLGKALGGKSVIKDGGYSDSISLKVTDFILDFGLLFGVDYMFNSTIGARASYFIGLVDVLTNEPLNNYKNRGIGICLLYKI